MSFRERIHWSALIAMLLAFGWYFAAYPWDVIDTPAGLGASAGMLVLVTILIIVTMSVTAAFFAIRSPKEAHIAEDERERRIHLLGTHFAYYPLVIAVWLNAIAQFYRPSAALALNLLLATAVGAELVRVGVQLWLYRREG